MSKADRQIVAESTPAVSSSLIGEAVHSLDPKKRLTIPSAWRAAMGNPAYLYVLPDRNGQCLDILPKAEMDVMLAKLRQKALFDPALNQAAMAIGRVSEMLPLDVQGRIRISDKLLQFANLKTTVAMQGAVRMIQLWDPDVLPPVESVDQAGLGEALAMAGF